MIKNNLHSDKIYFDFVNSIDDYKVLQNLIRYDEGGRLNASKQQFNPVLEDYDAYIKQYREDIANNKRIRYIIRENSTNNIVGDTSIKDMDFIHRNCSLSIYISKDYRGKGYGLDTMSILKNIAFLNYNFHKMSLIYYGYNEGVGEFYKKAGFEVEGELKDEVFMNGKYYSVFCMATFNPDNT